MRIVLDAMGGDDAPETPVAAAVAALDREGSFEIVLIGDEQRIQPLLASRRYPAARLSVVHAPEVIEMDDAPARAMRHKRRSSVVAGLELQRTGQADAFISAGNTGAVMAAALLTLGRIEGVARPAILATFPTQQLPCVVLDVGANAECRPRHLMEFALMGHAYAIDVLGRSAPRVGLLSIGEEPGKGNDLTIETHARLSASPLNFIGNVEGRDVLRGEADVVVCDGFVGNVLLKFGESFADFLADSLQSEVRGRKLAALGAFLMRPAIRSVRRRIDYAEYGGAPLLGVNGIVVIGHGGSSAKAFSNAIDVARRAVKSDLNQHIAETAQRFARSGMIDGSEGLEGSAKEGA